MRQANPHIGPSACRSCNTKRYGLAAVHGQVSEPRSRGVLPTDLTCCTQHSALSARACQCDRWRMDPGPAADGCQAQHTMLAVSRLASASSLDHMLQSCSAADFFVPQSITMQCRHTHACSYTHSLDALQALLLSARSLQEALK